MGEEWVERVLSGGTKAMAQEMGLGEESVIKRFRAATGTTPNGYRRRVLDGLAPEAVKIRNAGASWGDVERWYRERVSWLCGWWTKGVPGHAAQCAVKAWATRNGVKVRTTASHDPGRAWRALALREEGLPYCEVTRRSRVREHRLGEGGRGVREAAEVGGKVCRVG